MSFPFLIIENENAPKDAVMFVGMRYKTVPVGQGEPPKTETVIDWEATGRASVVITGIGESKCPE